MSLNLLPFIHVVSALEECLKNLLRVSPSRIIVDNPQEVGAPWGTPKVFTMFGISCSSFRN